MARRSTKPAKRAEKARVPRVARVSTARLATDDEIYTQLKICLSKITRFSIDQIFSTDSLADKYRFTAGGLRVLAQNLEACFANNGNKMPRPLSRDKMQAAKTVGDVAGLINEVFGV
jgi:hypothetical protein